MIAISFALWGALLFIGLLCFGIWVMRDVLDAPEPVEWHVAALITPPPAADASDAELEAWAAEALFIANAPAALERTLREIRSLPEVTA
jgi:hypothetical protein